MKKLITITVFLILSTTIFPQNNFSINISAKASVPGILSQLGVGILFSPSEFYSIGPSVTFDVFYVGSLSIQLNQFINYKLTALEISTNYYLYMNRWTKDNQGTFGISFIPGLFIPENVLNNKYHGEFIPYSSGNLSIFGGVGIWIPILIGEKVDIFSKWIITLNEIGTM